jgi:alpha-1,2-mannosyltransferase
MSRLVQSLRAGAWVTPERMRFVAFAMLIAGALGAAALALTATGLDDRFGRPFGTDFSIIYVAGTDVLQGRAADPYDPVRLHDGLVAMFGPDAPWYGWHYPPFFLALAALLALMPYGLSLAVWQSASFAVYLLSIRAVLSGAPSVCRDGRLWLLLAAAFPAVFINLGHGQNGFLTAALLAAALVQIDRRPVLAGILFACLAYKPQFGLLIPLVLAASGRWRVFASAAVTVLLMTVAVTLALGADIWSAFFASAKVTRVIALEEGGTGWEKIQSVFSIVRMWGGGVPLAYAAQGAVTAGIAAALVWLWRGAAPFALKAAALALGCVLATPYSIDYDLMLLAPAIAFLARNGFEGGFAPYEKSALAALWLVPLVARNVAQLTLIPLAVPAMLLAFVLLLQRAQAETVTRKASGVLPAAS